jgi:hypothetical protein
MAFQCEEATKLVKGQRVPLTRGDIAAETGLTPAQVRRSLVALEQEGYAERQGGDGGLRKGEITIHCWAIPRPAKSDPVQDEKLDRLEIPEDLPAYLQKWIRKFRLERMPDAETLAKAERICETIETSTTELRNLLKPADSESQARTPAKTARATPVSPTGVHECTPHTASTPSKQKRYTQVKDSGKTDKKKEEKSVGLVVVSDRPTDPLLLAIVQTGITEKLKDTPSTALLGRIALALNGSGYDALKARIDARFDSITGLGMIEGLAKDVAKSAGDPRRLQPNGSRTDAVKNLALQNLERTGRLL